MEVLSAPIILCTLAIAFSLLIERILEIIKTLFILVDSEFDLYRFWTKRAIKLRGKLEKRIRLFDYVHPSYLIQFFAYAKEYIVGGQDGVTAMVPTISGDLVRGIWIKTISKFLGISIGIILAHWQNIDFFMICHSLTNKQLFPAAEHFAAIGVTVSGIAMGLGVSPVHKIITHIEQKKETKNRG